MATATLSFDIEEFDFPIECGGKISENEQFEISSEGVEYLLETLKDRNITATFFVTANFAFHRKDLIRKIVDNGHEIASHDYYHSAKSKSDILGSKKVLETISGKEVIGYRPPRLTAVSSASLHQAGYKYDSSINPTWIPGRYNNLFSSRRVYIKDNICIYPISVAYPIRIPVFWLSLHIMPFPIYRLLIKSVLWHERNINLYFHPWEFSDKIQKREFKIPFYISRTSGIRFQLKFEKFLDFLIEKNTDFKTTREYLKK